MQARKMATLKINHEDTKGTKKAVACVIPAEAGI
jgi:hypothetical protein